MLPWELYSVVNSSSYTVKGTRGKVPVSFDSQNDKYVIWKVTCDKYASGEASQENCEAYFSFCESNDTLPQAPFTVKERGL
jgi:hypothetical protein